ncbi:hypothetical protein BDR07DRAFT_1493722 [Suillus spraguei]|nr:hypothetical protein BDR07DRAFT_1493722 [Suillus spraguei]
MHFKGKDINKGTPAKETIFSSSSKMPIIITALQQKNAARVKPPNLLVKTSNGECSSSFAAVVDELKTLKQQIVTEALVILICGSCDLNLQPKVHFTCVAAKQFLRTATCKDPMEFACKLEGYILSGGIRDCGFSLTHKERVKLAKQTIRSSMQAGLIQITGKTNVNFEYLCYEAAVVQEHLVKVVGWNHKDWANPSNLKRGIKALETLASTVKAKTCKFEKAPTLVLHYLIWLALITPYLAYARLLHHYR